jgi:hypothetical protein
MVLKTLKLLLRKRILDRRKEEEEIFVPSGDEGTALGRGFSRGIDVAGRGFGSALEGAR